MATIDQTKELNALLEAQKKLYKEQNDLVEGQLRVMRQLADVVRQLNLETTAQGMDRLNSAVKSAGEAVQELSSGQQTLQRTSEAAEQAQENLDGMGTAAERFGRRMLKLAPVVATFEGMAAGMRLSLNTMSNLIGISKGLIGSFLNLGASIVALPFKILTGLMAQTGGGGSELRQQIEKVRGTFGDLAQNESKAVMSAWRGMNHFGGRLAETGLSLWRTMGGMAETLEKVAEMAGMLGPLWSSLNAEVSPTVIQRWHAYRKGLGLTEEAFQAMGARAAALGKDFQEMGREVTSVVYSMGRAVGINGRLIGESVGKMMADFDHFGNLSVRELAQVAVYARKLGVEVEKLTGALDAFADFDKAAESVAHLSQAFGIQLDTLELVQEQDPAKNVERLRKAFFAAGKTYETLNRQERAHLANLTQMDQQTLSLVFSAQKQGMTYEDIQKQGEQAEKQQLTQAEAMQQLANSIERLVRSGQQLRGGFIDIFLQGFLRGTRWTKEFWTMMVRLRRAMRATYHAGIQVGRLFVDQFPGVRDVLVGIAEIFDPRRFRKMLQGVVDAFKQFFTDMTTNPQAALPRLLERLKENFINWFDASTPAGRQIINGFKAFFKALGQIFGSLTEIAIKGAVKAIRGLISFIKDPSKAIGAAKAAGGGFANFMAEVLQPAWEAIKEQGPALLDALKDLFALVWPKAKAALMKVLPAVAAGMFGPAFIGGMSRALVTSLGAIFIQGIGSFIKSGALRKGAGLLSQGLGRVTQATTKLTEIAPTGGGARGVKTVSATVSATADMDRETRGFGARQAVQLGLKLVAIAGALSLGGIMVAGSIVGIKAILDAGGINRPEDAALPMGILAATIVGMAGVGAAIQLFRGINIGAIGKALLGLVAVAALVEGMAFHFVHITDVLSDVTPEAAKKVALGMGAMVGVYAAASGITVIASLVGSIMAGGGGVGTLLILAGLAVIAGVVEGAAIHAIHIMEMINKFRPEPGFEQKSKVFLNIIKVLGDFAGNISGIVDAAGPSFIGLLASPWGRDPQRETQRTIGLVVELIKAMGEQIRMLVDNIVAHVQNVSVADLEKADKVSMLIGAISGLAEALTPPPEMVDNIATALGLAPSTLTAAAGFFQTSANTLRMLIPQVINMMGLINDLPEIDTNKVQAVGTFLNGLSAMMKALLPSGTTAGVLGIAQGISTASEAMSGAANDLAKFFGSDLRFEPRTDPAAQMLNFMRQYATAMMQVIIQFMPAIQAFLGGMANIAGQIPAEKIRSLEVVGEIFDKVVNVLTSFAEILSPDKIKNLKGFSPESIQEVGSTMAGFVGSTIKILTGQFPMMINQLVEAAGAISTNNIGKLKEIIPIISSSFALVSNLTDLVNKLGEGGANIGEGEEFFKARLGGIRGLLSSLFASDTGMSIISAIQTLGAAQLPRNTATNAQTIQEAFSSIGSLVSTVNTDIISNISKAAEGLDTALIDQMGDGVSALVERLEGIDSALRTTRTFNIPTKLRELSSKLGLASSGRLTITQEPINFNVNFSVRVDAEDLESVLVERQGSRFAVRNRG